MRKKRIVGLGAVIGLVIGIISIVAGVYLPGDASLVAAFFAFESPLIHIINWLGKDLHNWGSFTAVYILLVLLYWTLIGLLFGLSVRWFIKRKGNHAA